MDIHPFTCGASTVGKKSIALPMTLSHCLTQNLTQGFAQLAVVRISWWVLLLRKLAGVMGHGSLQFAIAPRAFTRGGLVFSSCFAEACGFARVDSVLGRGAVILGKCRRCSARGGYQPGQDLLPLSFEGVFLGVPPAKDAFSPFLPLVQGVQHWCRIGCPPRGPKHPRCATLNGKDTDGY